MRKEIKRRENKRVAARSFKKLGRKIRGHIKLSSLKNNSLRYKTQQGFGSRYKEWNQSRST
jgi:hypothetical protein